mmetsp:Transcript_49506/g.116220  ORF Transcript_49506/g.116220 Transcript_49506/m.116220 type:complete len:315 (-) Transcript_49506:129-1073(-)
MPINCPTKWNMRMCSGDVAAGLGMRRSRLKPWSPRPFGVRMKRGVLCDMRSRQHSLIVSRYGPPASVAPSPWNTTSHTRSLRRRFLGSIFSRAVKICPITDRRPSLRGRPALAASAAARAVARLILTLGRFADSIVHLHAFSSRSILVLEKMSALHCSSIAVSDAPVCGPLSLSSGRHLCTRMLKRLSTTNRARSAPWDLVSSSTCFATMDLVRLSPRSRVLASSAGEKDTGRDGERCSSARTAESTCASSGSSCSADILAGSVDRSLANAISCTSASGAQLSVSTPPSASQSANGSASRSPPTLVARRSAAGL